MANPKIEIFKLDIDVDAAIAAQSKLKAETDTVKAALDALKKSGDTSSQTFVELAATHKYLNSEYNSSRNQLSKLLSLQGKEITTLEQGRNALSAVSKEWAKQASLYGENSVEADKLAKKKLELTSRLKELESATGDNTRNVGNYTESMKDALNQTNLFGGSLTTVSQYGNIFKGVLQTAGQQAKNATDQIRDAAAGTEGLSKAQKAGVITTNLLSGAMKLLKVALISTGIGAIVVILGSLITYLTTTQKGIDKVTSVTKPLTAVFQTLLGVIQNFGGDIFNNPLESVTKLYNFVKDQVIKTFDAWWKIASGIATLNFDKAGEGIQDLKDQADQNAESLKNFGKEIGNTFKEAYERGQEVDRMTKELSKSEADFIELQSQLKQELKEQNLIAEDQTKTLAEREAAAKRTVDISREINDEQRKRLELERDILVLNTKNNDTSDADRAEIAAKNAAISESNATQLELETTQQNKLNGIRKQANNEALRATNARIDAEIKASEEKIALFIAEQGFRKKSDQEAFESAKQLRDSEIALLKQKYEAGKVSETAYQTELINIKNKFTQEQADIFISNFEDETEALISQIERRKTTYADYTEERKEEEINNLRETQEALEELELAKFEKGVTNEKEYHNALAQVRLEAKEKRDELEAEYADVAEEKRILNLELKTEIEDLNTEDEFVRRQAKLDRERQQAIESAQGEAAAIKLIKEKFDIFDAQLSEDKKQRDNAVAMNKLSQWGAVANSVSGMLDKESVAGKAAAIAQATINVAQGVTKAIAEGGLLGIATGALVAVAGGISIGKILSTDTPKRPKYEKGGIFKIGGRRHSSGGTKFQGEDGTAFEAEQGELISVMNRNAAAAFMAFNDAYPSGAGARTNYLASGGIVKTITGGAPLAQKIPIPERIDYDKFGQKVTEGVSRQPIYIAVTEINDGQRKYARVIEGANI